MFRRLVATVASCSALAVAAAPAPASATAKSFDHVYVIMMENQSFDNLIGHNQLDSAGNFLRLDTPFITSAALRYGVSTLYFGVTHPSLPNYLTTIAGDYFGIADDNSSCYATDAVAGACHKIDAPNLIDRLESKHLTWTSLDESMPTAGFLGSQYPGPSPRLYAQKHNPFVYFKDIAGNPQRLANIKPLTSASLDQTLAAPPNLTYIVPNQCDDMHGTKGCSNLDGLLQTGDAYLQKLATRIAASPKFTKNSAIFVIWDEDDYSSNFGCCSSVPAAGGGHTLAMVYSSGSLYKRSATPMNHYSFLRTILDGFGLAPLGHSHDADVASMWELF